MSLHVVVLAAGRGTRMKSALPKVMHTLAGKPLLRHVVDAAHQLESEAIHIVVGHGAEHVRAAFGGADIVWSEQAEQLGTAHAVAQALPAIPPEAQVLILYGDVPLIGVHTLSALLKQVNESTLALLTMMLDDPTGYGRIVRDGTGGVRSIVEQKDASEVERAIREVNTGVMALPAGLLHEMMPRIGCNNAQGEYYLTDLVALCVEHGKRIATAQPSSPQEVEGVNNRVQLAQLERWYQRRLAERLAMEGVTIADPDRIDIRGELRCGADSFIDVNCVFEGSVSIGQNVTIGPNNVLRNVRVGDGTVIEANCVLEDSIIGAGCNVGPFARTRPGTQLATGAKLGNFVETKNAQIGDGAKVNHLSYVGDAVVGAGTNIGAGTITCNYDGANKYKTEIGPDVFVGSNTALVAPVVVAKGATIAAGSVITGDVGENQLAVARGKQRNIDGWKRPQKKPKT